MTDTTTETAEFTIRGLSVGHGCDDCERLTIAPAAVHTAGASYELVARITAGDSHEPDPWDGKREGAGVSILVEDIPKVIAELQKIHDRAVLAEAEQRIPSEWPVHD